jgi:hypothetical protein
MMMFWVFLIPHDDMVWILKRLFGAKKEPEATIGANMNRWAAHAWLATQQRAVSGVPAFFQRQLQSFSTRFNLEKLEPETFAPYSPARIAFGNFATRVKTGLFAFMAVVFVVQTTAQNRAVPPSMKIDPPFWVVWPVEYLHFFQGWGMFAVSPREDSTVVVRAQTTDGRLVDPLSERSSPNFSPPGMRAILTRLDHDEYWCDYLSRISNDRQYEAPLREWILRYPQRTGRPNDRIVSFDVVQLTDTSPMYGETVPTNQQERVLLHYP